MSYHTVVYNVTNAAAGATNVDLLAATDSEITQRNNHYTFSENYRLLGAMPVGASITRGRFQVPHWNAYMEATLFNPNRAATVPSNPQWDLYVAYPPTIPLEEEFQVQLSNNLGAATEVESVILQLAPDDWNQNLPKGELMAIARATLTLTPTANAWSGPQIITFSQSLRGGVWAIVGTVVQGSNALAWRWVFPRNKMYSGRRLRPGGPVQNAVGDVINQQLDPWVMGWGLQGLFHTFELPQLDIFGLTAGAITYQIFVWLVYLGQSKSILDQYVSSGH